MQPTNIEQEAFIHQMAGYANYLHKQGWPVDKIKTALISRGLDEAAAACIIDGFERAKKQRIDNAKTKFRFVLHLVGMAGRA